MLFLLFYVTLNFRRVLIKGSNQKIDTCSWVAWP